MRFHLRALHFAVLGTLISPLSQAISINVVGSLGDLDGDGDTTYENLLVRQVASDWSGKIQGNKHYTVNVLSGNLGGGTGIGWIQSFDGDGFPNAGNIFIGNNLGSFNWWVDKTPDDTSEFAQDSTYPFLWMVDPLGSYLDLYSCLAHEFGHALGMVATPADLSYNPRYTSNLVQKDVPGTGPVWFFDFGDELLPMNNDLSHFAVVGTLGKGRTLMDSPRLVYNGYMWRTSIDPLSASAVDLIHNPRPSVPIPELSTSLFIGTGLLGFCAFRKFRFTN